MSRHGWCRAWVAVGGTGRSHVGCVDAILSWLLVSFFLRLLSSHFAYSSPFASSVATGGPFFGLDSPVWCLLSLGPDIDNVWTSLAGPPTQTPPHPDRAVVCHGRPLGTALRRMVPPQPARALVQLQLPQTPSPPVDQVPGSFQLEDHGGRVPRVPFTRCTTTTPTAGTSPTRRTPTTASSCTFTPSAPSTCTVEA